MTFYNLAHVLPTHSSLMLSFIFSLWFALLQPHISGILLPQDICTCYYCCPHCFSSLLYHFQVFALLTHSQWGLSNHTYLNFNPFLQTHTCVLPSFCFFFFFFILLLITYFHLTQFVYTLFTISYLTCFMKTRISVSYILCFISSTLSIVWHITVTKLIYVEWMNK